MHNRCVPTSLSSMINAPITTTAVSGMPLSQAGVAAAFASTSRQVGVSIGVALEGTVTGVGASRGLGTSFAIATHPLWWIVVGCGLSIVGIGLISTSRWARDSALTVRHLLEEPAPAAARVVTGADVR